MREQATKTRISIGQCLLLLIDEYRHDSQKANELKKLYLSGLSTQGDIELFQKYLQALDMNEYIVEINKQSINNDPTRRYFETHLAFHTLETSLQYMIIDDLEAHLTLLYSSLPSSLPKDERLKIDRVLTGIIQDTDRDLYKEFGDFIGRVQLASDYERLPIESKQKLLLLVKASFLGVVTAIHHNSTLPINIYGIGIYADTNKGQQLKLEQSQVRSQHRGIMKSYHPVPQDDPAISDVAFPYLRPADQATIDYSAQWPELNFVTLVHPFSNGISGTILCQLRNLRATLANHDCPFQTTESLGLFIKNFISALLLNSGGHSLNEFVYVLSLPEVQKSFTEIIPNFTELNLSSLFFTSNTAAIDASIESAIKYNKRIIQKKKLHTQLKESSSLRSAVNTLPTQSDLYGRMLQYTERASKLNCTTRFTYFTDAVQSRELIILNRALDRIEDIQTDVLCCSTRKNTKEMGTQWRVATAAVSKAFTQCQKSFSSKGRYATPQAFPDLLKDLSAHWSQWQLLSQAEQLQRKPCLARIIGIPVMPDQKKTGEVSMFSLTDDCINYAERYIQKPHNDLCVLVAPDGKTPALPHEAGTSDPITQSIRQHFACLISEGRSMRTSSFGYCYSVEILSAYCQKRSQERQYHGMMLFGKGFGSCQQIKLAAAQQIMGLIKGGFPGHIVVSKKHLRAMVEPRARLTALLERIFGPLVINELGCLLDKQKKTSSDLQVNFSFRSDGMLTITATAVQSTIINTSRDQASESGVLSGPGARKIS